MTDQPTPPTRPVPPGPPVSETLSRPGEDAGKHRAEVRPRYGRIGVLGVSLATTAVALLGGLGVLPLSGSAGSAALQSGRAPAEAAYTQSTSPQLTPVSPAPSTSGSGGTTGTESAVETSTALPKDSGQGRRVVFDQSDQRVWLVGGRQGRVLRTYLVSGSVTDNLQPGTYQVFSRSMNAIGIDDSGTMTHFVRFTRGPSGAAIGFHDIPKLDGDRVQTQAQLGTPRSHGCIRQAEGDAVAMWRFAQMDTDVVVTA